MKWLATTGKFPYTSDFVRNYSTTVSASACHAEDTSSILVSCSSERFPKGNVKGK